MSVKQVYGPKVGAPWGTSNSKAHSSEVRTGTNPNWHPLSNTRNFITKTRIMGSGVTPRVGTFLKPTLFRSYVCTHEVPDKSGFSYNGFNGSGTKIVHRGNAGYIPNSTDIFLGTSGAGRFPLTSSNLRQRAITECVIKLKDGNANLAESLATMNQTLGMLLKAVLTLAKSLKQARDILRAKKLPESAVAAFHSLRGPRRGRNARRLANKFGKELSNRWLELQYGWKPLVSDINTLLDLANSQSKRIKQRVFAVRHVSEENDLPSLAPKTTGAIMQVSGSVRSGASCRIDAEINNPLLYTFDKLGLTNPWLLFWELIPFSFVVDWLIPIGNVLKGLTSWIGLSFLGGSVTTWTRADLTIRWTQYRYDIGEVIRSNVKSLSNERTLLSKWPIAGVYMKNPFSSLTRAATALALLNQLRR